MWVCTNNVHSVLVCHICLKHVEWLPHTKAKLTIQSRMKSHPCLLRLLACLIHGRAWHRVIRFTLCVAFGIHWQPFKSNPCFYERHKTSVLTLLSLWFDSLLTFCLQASGAFNYKSQLFWKRISVLKYYLHSQSLVLAKDFIFPKRPGQPKA